MQADNFPECWPFWEKPFCQHKPTAMKKHLLLFVLLTIAAQTFAQVMGNYGVQKQQEVQQQQNYPRNNYFQNQPQFRSVARPANILDNNQLETSINALSNQKAESYVAIFAMLQVGKTADETNTLLNARLDGFLAELKNLGIPANDIYVDMVNFLPKYEYDVSKKLFSKKTYTEIPKGFELQKNIHIRYTTPALLDRIVTAAARQEIYDIVKVDYFVKDSDKVYSQLRDAAFQYLATIKSQYRKAGIGIDSAYVITGENAWVTYPINQYESYQVFSTQRLDNDEKNNAVINSADKPVSRFYNAVPANDYDIVINPEILEPAVQFSYNLIVRFTLPERKPSVRTEVKKEFILVTPTGEVKSLKIE